MPPSVLHPGINDLGGGTSVAYYHHAFAQHSESAILNTLKVYFGHPQPLPLVPLMRLSEVRAGLVMSSWEVKGGMGGHGGGGEAAALPALPEQATYAFSVIRTNFDLRRKPVHLMLF